MHTKVIIEYSYITRLVRGQNNGYNLYKKKYSFIQLLLKIKQTNKTYIHKSLPNKYLNTKQKHFADNPLLIYFAFGQ